MPHISDAKMERYRETARQRKALTEQRRLQRLDFAWEIARRAAHILYQQLDCEQVVAFGSIMHPDLFHTHSDVDLAVRGIAERDYLKAVAMVTSLNSELLIDLIRIEEISGSLLQVIKREGRVL